MHNGSSGGEDRHLGYPSSGVSSSRRFYPGKKSSYMNVGVIALVDMIYLADMLPGAVAARWQDMASGSLQRATKHGNSIRGARDGSRGGHGGVQLRTLLDSEGSRAAEGAKSKPVAERRGCTATGERQAKCNATDRARAEGDGIVGIANVPGLPQASQWIHLLVLVTHHAARVCRWTSLFQLVAGLAGRQPSNEHFQASVGLLHHRSQHRILRLLPICVPRHVGSRILSLLLCGHDQLFVSCPHGLLRFNTNRSNPKPGIHHPQQEQLAHQTSC